MTAAPTTLTVGKSAASTPARPWQTARGHLRDLEADSIFILWEAAGKFRRPVLPYSIGKDSSALLRLAEKAFFPGKIPFPLLHVDTGYKFPEMIAFCDHYARKPTYQRSRQRGLFVFWPIFHDLWSDNERS